MSGIFNIIDQLAEHSNIISVFEHAGKGGIRKLSQC